MDLILCGPSLFLNYCVSLHTYITFIKQSIDRGGRPIGSKTLTRGKQSIYDNKIRVRNQVIAGVITDRYSEAKKISDKVNLKLIINRVECEFHVSTGTIKNLESLRDINVP